MTATATKPETEPLLRVTEVEKLVGLSRTTIWRMRRDGLFPQPLQYSPGKQVWRESQITAWLANLEPVS